MTTTRIFLALVFLCAFAAFSNAANGNANSGSGNSSPPIINIDVSGIINAITSLPSQIINAFFSYVVSGLIDATHQLVDFAFRFMFSSPDPMWFCNSYNGIMAIIETLYSLALMGLALYFILRSGDAEGRANAKIWLENMLIMMVVLAFSFQIFQIMLDLNTYLANSFASESMKSIFTTPVGFASAILALVVLIPSMGGMMLTLLTLLVRYLLIPFLLFLFPVAIFLYFVPLTQKWGRAFLTLIVAVVFMTAFDALVLLALSSLFNSPDPTLADPIFHMLAVLFGFGALGILNVLIFVLAILSVIFQNNSVRGLVGFAVAGKVLTR